MADTEIIAITARRIWDSRGRPTVEADVRLADGSLGRGVAPAGASRGRREAIDKRDGSDVLGGFDVQQALAGIRDEIAPALRGMDAQAQEAVDGALIALDGTPDKARLGGNALVAVSLGVLQAAARSSDQPLWRYLAGDSAVTLPMPEIQIFGGGAHAGRRIDIQDVMIVPVSATSIAQALAMGAEVYRAAGELMAQRALLYGVADEGGYWPVFNRNEDALDMLMHAIERARLVPGEDIALSLDIAASEFGAAGRYRLALEQKEYDSEALCRLLCGWCERYPIIAIEDPLAEDDTAAWQRFTQTAGARVQVIGDDYLVTNASLIEAARQERSVNAALIKINQAGTLSQAQAAVNAARGAGFGTIVSARSGETEDVAIAHLAVGWNSRQIKVGAFARSERMAKWNELLRIEEALGAAARFAGLSGFPRTAAWAFKS
jgi:enolase